MPDDATATIPEPEATGAQEVQRAPTPDESKGLVVRVRGEEGIGHFPISETIKEIQEAGVRGQAGMSLLYAVIHKLEGDVKSLKEDLRRVQESADSWQQKCHSAQTDNAVLRERLKSESRTRRLQNVLLTLGGLVAGVAAPYLAQDRPYLALAATLLGLGLLVAGWWPATEREES